MRGVEHVAAISSDEREAGLRVGDREREQVVDLLAQHAAEGRLSPEELEARIDEAHAARTRGQLAVLTTDLPASETSDRSASRAARGSRPGLPGPLVAFVAVNLVLVGVWALSGAGYFWPVWPLLGWGLSLVKTWSGGRGHAGRTLAHREPVCRLPRSSGAGAYPPSGAT